MGVGADGLGKSDDKVAGGAAGEGKALARVRPALGEDLEAVPETARGEAKETVLIMGRGERIFANAFIDSSDAKYNGVFAFAKCPFTRIKCDFRLSARRFERCKALAVRVALCFGRASRGQLVHESNFGLFNSSEELSSFLFPCYILPLRYINARGIYAVRWEK